MTITVQEEQEIRQKVELELRMKYLEREHEELKQRVEEIHAMTVSTNEAIIALEGIVKSVAEPLNNDIKDLKKFAHDFRNTKSRILGGVIVLSIVIGSLWGVVAPVLSKLLSLKIGAS